MEEKHPASSKAENGSLLPDPGPGATLPPSHPSFVLSASALPDLQAWVCTFPRGNRTGAVRGDGDENQRYRLEKELVPQLVAKRTCSSRIHKTTSTRESGWSLLPHLRALSGASALLFPLERPGCRWAADFPSVERWGGRLSNDTVGWTHSRKFRLGWPW